MLSHGILFCMIPESRIQHVAVHLGEAANASQVILFGSYARGEATDRRYGPRVTSHRVRLSPLSVACNDA